jgi:hypothetical protein
MGPESTLIGPPRIDRREADVVWCDQAIFSSARTATGHGYQILATSRGVTLNEKKAIHARSPSHGGLCRTDPEARAFAFYPLGNGRVALAHSCDAGAESSGRGARRIYTHVTLLDANELGRFGFNPFHVLRAIQRTGMLEPQLQPPGGLPLLELDPRDAMDVDRLNAVANTVGPCWLTYATACALEDQHLVLAGQLDLYALMEAILLGVPGPMRVHVPFSAGLRFSIGRAYGMTAICGDTHQTQRMVRGQRLQYVEPARERDVPHDPADAWSAMVARLWGQGRGRELSAIASQAIPDCSASARERIGSLCNEMDWARSANAHALLERGEARAEEVGANDFEADLLRKLIVTLQDQLCERLRAVDDVDEYRSAVLRSLQRSPQAAEFVIPAIEVMLDRQAADDPIRAVAWGGEILDVSQHFDLSHHLLKEFSRVLEWLGPRLHGASDKDLERVRTALSVWRFHLPGFDGVADTLRQIDEQLAATPRGA